MGEEKGLKEKERKDLENKLLNKIRESKEIINYSNKVEISHKMYSLIKDNLGVINKENYIKTLDNLYKRLQEDSSQLKLF
jgi:adenylyl- and sulfurtransferase ThiI